MTDLPAGVPAGSVQIPGTNYYEYEYASDGVNYTQIYGFSVSHVTGGYGVIQTLSNVSGVQTLDNSGSTYFYYATAPGSPAVTTVYEIVPYSAVDSSSEFVVTVAAFSSLSSISDGGLLSEFNSANAQQVAFDVFSTEQSNSSGGETLTVTSASSNPADPSSASGQTLLTDVGTSNVSYAVADFTYATTIHGTSGADTTATDLATFEVITTTVSGDQVSYDTKFYETDAASVTLLFDAAGDNGASPLPAPLVASGPALTGSIDAAAGAGGLIVFDPGTGSNTVTVQLTASDGTLSTVVDGVSTGGSSQLNLTGDLATVNTELGALTFTGTALGSGTITAVATYNGVSSTAATIATTVDDVAPVLENQTASQMWTDGQAVSFALPAGTFVDLGGETLTYQAGIYADGQLQPLPSWLSADPTTGALTGTAPAAPTSTSFEIYIDATNTSGQTSAFDTFAVTLVEPPPTLSITGPTGPTDTRLQTVTGQIDAAQAGLTVSVYDGANLIGQATPNANGLWSASVLLTSEGTQTLTAAVTDDGVVYSSSGVSVTLAIPAARDDYDANGQSQLLIENTSGVVVVGAVSGGTASYAQVSTLGPEWSFHGNGDSSATATASS